MDKGQTGTTKDRPVWTILGPCKDVMHDTAILCFCTGMNMNYTYKKFNPIFRMFDSTTFWVVHTIEWSIQDKIK